MKNLSECIMETASSPYNYVDKNSKMSLITKYLDPWTVESQEKKNKEYDSYLIVCNRREDVSKICKGVWEVIRDWYGKEKLDEEAVKYMTGMWLHAWDTIPSDVKKKYIKIPFDLYNK